MFLLGVNVPLYKVSYEVQEYPPPPLPPVEYNNTSAITFNIKMRVFFIVRLLPNRAKLSGEIFVGRNYLSLSEKFVTFARRKIRNLSYFMPTQYNLYISAPSKNYSSGEIFVTWRKICHPAQNLSPGEKFVTRRKIRHPAKNSSPGEKFVTRRKIRHPAKNSSPGEKFVTRRKIRHLAKNSSPGEKFVTFAGQSFAR